MAPNSNKLLFWFQRTEIKIVGKLAKIKRSVLRVGARLADISCSAVPTPLLYSLVDTNISLWTRTNATCTLCVCVWMCVCSAQLFKWFKLMFLVHVAAFSVNDWSDRLFELSESVSCAIRASPLLLSCSRPNHLCPYRTTMSFDFLLDIIFISTFHTFPPGASRIEGRPVAGGLVGVSAGGNASISWNGRKQKPTDHHWIPGVLHFQDIPLHCFILVVQSSSMSERAPRLLCALMQHWYLKHYFNVCLFESYFVADDYWCWEDSRQFLTSSKLCSF